MGGKNIKAIKIVTGNNQSDTSKSPKSKSPNSILISNKDTTNISPMKTITFFNDEKVSSPFTRHESMNPKILQSKNSFINLNSSPNKKKFSIKEEGGKISLFTEVNKIFSPNIIKKVLKKSKKNESLPSDEVNILKVIKKHNKEFDDAKLLENSLTKHFLIRSLDRQSRAEVIKQMSLCKVDEGDTIFSQFSIGNYFYIIQSGTVKISINDVKIKTLQEGDSFGDLAFLHDAPRSATVKALTECYLWVLERKNFKKIINHIKDQNFDENKKFVESISLLANIENDSKNIISANMIKETYELGDQIIKFGEVSNNLYILKEGLIECKSKDIVIRKLKKGDYFGERGLLLNSTRSMDVIAKSHCVCFSISSTTFISLIGENFRDVIILNFVKNALANSKYLKNLSSKLIDYLSECFQIINYNLGEIAFNRGHQKNSLLSIVIEGNLINTNDKEVIASRGSILFEKYIIKNKNSILDYDISASPDCLLVQANINELNKMLGTTLNDLSYKTSIIESILKLNLFRNLPLKKLEILSNKIQEQKYENGETIISQGEEGINFYIIKSGKVDIYVNYIYSRTLNEGEVFGEKALFLKEKRSASVIANGKVELFYLEKDDFLDILENNMKEHLFNRLYLQDSSIELKDLDFIGNIGSGNYGTVSLVQSKRTKFKYAIKVISKKQIDHDILHNNLELERAILLQIDHPFIVKLVKTIKDDKNIYFLMEYVRGKELFEIIREIGLLNRYQTQFFGASIMLAVEYLHERNYIYRDIKPENIMVTDSGFIKLIDFGTSKHIKDKTSTIIGTPHYMAPEVIMGEGYSYEVDYWSIGVCMYEFMCGEVPFGESAEDPMDVYLAIINDKMNFPSNCKDKDFKYFLNLMLSKNPLNRISKLADIRNNIFFKDFSWDNLITLNCEPAYKPEITRDILKKSQIEYSNFLDKSFNDWEPDKSIREIDDKIKMEFDKWFNDF